MTGKISLSSDFKLVPLHLFPMPMFYLTIVIFRPTGVRLMVFGFLFFFNFLINLAATHF
jgi:hypothetical protein